MLYHYYNYVYVPLENTNTCVFRYIHNVCTEKMQIWIYNFWSLKVQISCKIIHENRRHNSINEPSTLHLGQQSFEDLMATRIYGYFIVWYTN